MRALLLRIGDDSYAVPMEQAREVVGTPVVTALPTAPATVLGVCNVRGEIIPVFDTGALLGVRPMTDFGAIVVMETALGPAGLAMSDIGASVELGELVADTETPGTRGARSLAGGIAVVIDLESLLAPARIV